MASSATDVLQGLIIADSFNARFTPVTLDLPRALLPLVNVPMLDYTIEFLAKNGIEEIFVFCFAHADQIRKHIDERWSTVPNLRVEPIISRTSMSPGEAMREVHQKQLIHSHFVLVSGDVVSNINLAPIIAQHKARHKADSRNIMTMVFKSAGPAHSSRAQEDDTVLAVDPHTQRILRWENSPSSRRISFDTELFQESEAVQLRYDLIDCHIDVCAPTVFFLFQENFDYLDLRSDFVKGVLAGSEIVDYRYRLFLNVAEGEYAARVRDLQTYVAVSRDVVHRWTFPMVLDSNWHGAESSFRHFRNNTYIEEPVHLARSCKIQQNTVVSSCAQVGEDSVVCNTIVGKNCSIGKDVTINGSFLWDNIIVEDGVKIDQSIICSGVKILKGAKIDAGCIIGNGVVIGAGGAVKGNSKLTSVAPNSSLLNELPTITRGIEAKIEPLPATAGKGAKGYIWLDAGGTAPPALLRSMTGTNILEQGDISEGEISEDSDEEGVGEMGGRQVFVTEVTDTLSRAMAEGHTADQVILELKSLRLTYDTMLMDCAPAVFPAVLGHVRDQKPLGAKTKAALKRWKPLLKLFMQLEEDQVEMVFLLQEYCEEEEGEPFRKLFSIILHAMYELELLEEDALLRWEEEQSALKSKEERKYLDQCKKFLDWLKEASEEEESD